MSVVAVAVAISVHVHLIGLFLLFRVSTKVYPSIIDSFVEYRLAMSYLPLVCLCIFSKLHIQGYFLVIDNKIMLYCIFQVYEAPGKFAFGCVSGPLLQHVSSLPKGVW